jgi:hypothetical protein
MFYWVLAKKTKSFSGGEITEECSEADADVAFLYQQNHI